MSKFAQVNSESEKTQLTQRDKQVSIFDILPFKLEIFLHNDIFTHGAQLLEAEICN